VSNTNYYMYSTCTECLGRAVPVYHVLDASMSLCMLGGEGGIFGWHIFVFMCACENKQAHCMQQIFKNASPHVLFIA